MKNKKICSHPFFTPERIETEILQELCNLGILDERHALLCYTDSATIVIGYLDKHNMNPLHICGFEPGCISVCLYSQNTPVRYSGDITTLQQMEFISTLYTHWGQLVTVLMKSAADASPWVYARAQENVAHWRQIKCIK